MIRWHPLESISIQPSVRRPIAEENSNLDQHLSSRPISCQPSISFAENNKNKNPQIMCQPNLYLPTDIEASTQSSGSSEYTTQSFAEHVKHATKSLTTSEAWIGYYDYKALCMPRIPFLKRTNRSIFFGLNYPIRILVSIAMGFQYSLSMTSGVTSVLRILSGGGILNFPPS